MSAYLSGSLEKHKAVMFSKFNFLKYLKQIFDGKKKKKNQVVFSVSDFIKWGKKNPLSTSPTLPPFTHKSTRCCDVDGHLEKSSLIVEERAVFPALCSTMRISATIFTSNN